MDKDRQHIHTWLISLETKLKIFLLKLEWNSYLGANENAVKILSQFF